MPVYPGALRVARQPETIRHRPPDQQEEPTANNVSDRFDAPGDYGQNPKRRLRALRSAPKCLIVFRPTVVPYGLIHQGTPMSTRTAPRRTAEVRSATERRQHSTHA